MPGNVTGPDIVYHRGEEVQYDFSRKAIVAVYINTSLDSSTALEVHFNFFDVELIIFDQLFPTLRIFYL